MTLPWIDADKSGPGRRKNPRGNLSKVMVRITISAGKIRALPIGNPCGRNIPHINARRKIKLEREKRYLKRAIFLFYLGKGNIFLAPKIRNRKAILKRTIVPPVGKFNKKAVIMPQITDRIEKNKAAMIVILKFKDS